MTSKAEANLSVLPLNKREAIYLCHILKEMGHPQPRTPMQTNNTMTDATINSKVYTSCGIRRLKLTHAFFGNQAPLITQTITINYTQGSSMRLHVLFS